MAELATKHQGVARKFSEGHFTVHKKTEGVLDYIKGDGGAVGLTDNPSALRRWMVAGPEEFQGGNQ